MALALSLTCRATCSSSSSPVSRPHTRAHTHIHTHSHTQYRYIHTQSHHTRTRTTARVRTVTEEVLSGPRSTPVAAPRYSHPNPRQAEAPVALTCAVTAAAGPTRPVGTTRAWSPATTLTRPARPRRQRPPRWEHTSRRFSAAGAAVTTATRARAHAPGTRGLSPGFAPGAGIPAPRRLSEDRHPARAAPGSRGRTAWV